MNSFLFDKLYNAINKINRNILGHCYNKGVVEDLNSIAKTSLCHLNVGLLKNMSFVNSKLR